MACCMTVSAQEVQKSELQKSAEAALERSAPVTSRHQYIRAYEDYFNKGKLKQGVECAAKASELYVKGSEYQEAFDLLRSVDQAIGAKSISTGEKAAAHYEVSKVRMKMYMNMHRAQSAQEHLNVMENYAKTSGDEDVMNDLLYNKANYYYTFGQNAKGNEVFKEMAAKLTASKEYDKVDKVYQTLIANGRRSNNASIVAQSYNNYMLWKDSVNALKSADEIKGLKNQISERDATIDDMDGTLTTRMAIIWGLAILAGALAAALVIGAVVLLRYILLTRKQQKTIKMANDSNAQKAKFISNISAQLEPTLQKLDKKTPEVKALLDFSSHIDEHQQVLRGADGAHPCEGEEGRDAERERSEDDADHEQGAGGTHSDPSAGERSGICERRGYHRAGIQETWRTLAPIPGIEHGRTHGRGTARRGVHTVPRGERPDRG